MANTKTTKPIVNDAKPTVKAAKPITAEELSSEKFIAAGLGLSVKPAAKEVKQLVKEDKPKVEKPAGISCRECLYAGVITTRGLVICESIYRNEGYMPIKADCLIGYKK